MYESSIDVKKSKIGYMSYFHAFLLSFHNLIKSYKTYDIMI
jgi:hypothetical protein